MRRDDSPGALNQKLHHERTDCQHRWGLREGPHRDYQERDKGSDDDSLPPADLLRNLAENDPPEDRSNRCNGGDGPNDLGVELVLHLQEGGVTILGPVTVKIEGGHQENHKDEEGKMTGD